ncbi:hypothetical protein RND71_042438 [Anisodus tanguticus]|uniref:Uncharacterized protein n=1 Tax=Anisodus tanguticus TaxID=243964 RepID=A0AAE1QRF8_9SOLA|nr:hypothetical protein RND71_042438 [Anisodus tanguticus]
MSDEDGPSNISPKSIGEFLAIEGKKVNFAGSIGLEGIGGLQLLDVKDNGGGGDVDGLSGLSLTLEEWMRLDAGEIDDANELSERTSKLLVAHHATCTDLFCGRSKRRGKSKNCGLLGNNFTVALMVQLHHPLRNYELVVSHSNEDDDDDDEPKPPKRNLLWRYKKKNIPEDEQIPQYKITEVHVAGLKTEQGKKKLWDSSTQQQSGSQEHVSPIKLDSDGRGPQPPREQED